MTDLARWCSSVLPVLAKELRTDAFWSEQIKALRRGAAATHLAVFQEPWLSYMLDGTKTVESRFATRWFAPYGLVHPGDAILIKASSGPVELDQRRLEAIRSEFGAAIPR